MLHLTREVRFTLHAGAPAEPLNGLVGNVTDAFGMYVAMRVCLEGEVDPASNYIENIKVIDERVRREVRGELVTMLEQGAFTAPRAVARAAAILSPGWRRAKLVSVRLYSNPFLFWELHVREMPMVRLTQRFEFSAAHRLHNPAMSDEQNAHTFGKCNNPEGHGHNYEFEVTVTGPVDSAGRLLDLDEFARVVNRTVVEPFDHKHLNRQTSQFAHTLPSVENIAQVIFTLLDPCFAGDVRLHSVRVWETGKTSAEFSR